MARSTPAAHLRPGAGGTTAGKVHPAHKEQEVNPREQYLPDSAAQPSNGSILAALMRIEKKIDAIALKQAGDVGLLALQVTAPPFVEEQPKGDDRWILHDGSKACPVTWSRVVTRNAHGLVYPARDSSLVGWQFVTAYRPAQEQA